jgi:hypothetical protein
LFTLSKGVSKTSLLPQQIINVYDMSVYDLLQIHVSQVNHPTSQTEELDDSYYNTNESPSVSPADDADTRLIHSATSFWKIVNFH